MRAAAAQSFSRRASRRSYAAGTSSRIGRPFAPIASAPAGLDATRIMPPRVASTHNRVSHKAGWYETRAAHRRRAPEPAGWLRLDPAIELLQEGRGAHQVRLPEPL